MKSFVLNSNQYSRILDVINDFELKITKSFQYKTKKIENVTLNLYNTKKLVLQGQDQDVNVILNWLVKEKVIKDNPFKSVKIENKKQAKLKIYWGGDESGVGDFFGPMVMTLVLTNKKTLKEFKNLKLKDSKTMNELSIFKTAQKLMKNEKYIFTKIITNSEFYQKKEAGQNKLEIMSKAYIDLVNEVNNFQKKENLEMVQDFVIDGFLMRKTFDGYVNKWNWKYPGKIHLYPKAEVSYLGVAAAAIISRFIFLEEIKKIEKKLKTKIALGASIDVKRQLNQLIEKHGKEKMTKYAKLHFKH